MKIYRDTKFLIQRHRRDKIILDLARKRKQIIYGAQSIKKQIGLYSRKTKDWDILDKVPNESARILEKKLDNLSKRNDYYIKQANYKKTWKVNYIGKDSKANTSDDLGIADYTKMEKVPKIRKFYGIRFRSLPEELRAKVKSINNPEFAYRFKKDNEDVLRIKRYMKNSRRVK